MENIFLIFLVFLIFSQFSHVTSLAILVPDQRASERVFVH